MTDKEQSLLNLLVELDNLRNSKAIDVLDTIIVRLNECGAEVERKNEAIRKLLREEFKSKETRPLAKIVGSNTDYLPFSFLKATEYLIVLKEQIQRLITAYTDVVPAETGRIIDDVIINDYSKKE